MVSSVFIIDPLFILYSDVYIFGYLSIFRVIVLVKPPAWTLKITPMGCPETSGANYQQTLRIIPQERIARLHRGQGLKSQITCCFKIGTLQILFTSKLKMQ